MSDSKSSNVRPHTIQVFRDSSLGAAPKVIQSDQASKIEIREFDANRLKALVKSPAVTAPRATHFALNPLSKQMLTLDEKEKLEIARRVKEEVSSISDTAIKQGFTDGMKAGREEGHQAAFNEFKAEAEIKLKRLDELVAGFENATHEILKFNEEVVIDLVYRIARHLALKELQQDRQYVVRLAKEVIDRLGIRDNVRIKVKPGDMELMSELKSNLSQTFTDLKNISIEGSDKIETEGVIIETEWTSVDARIETQLDEVLKLILKEREVGNQS